MSPANQSLASGNLSVRRSTDRLIVNLETPLSHRLPQIDFEQVARLGAGIQGWIEEAEGATAARFAAYIARSAFLTSCSRSLSPAEASAMPMLASVISW